MKKCDCCGEYRKVRFERDWRYIHLIIGKYICEDCDKAQKIICNKIIEMNKKEEEGIKEWIKERDKILKENLK